jgi:hypothetical protein
MLLAIASDKSTAMQPHHDRTLPAVVESGRPDIQAQAIFALDSIIPVEQESRFVSDN